MLKGAIRKAEEIDSQIPTAFIPQQFDNPANPLAHQHTTAKEILRDTKDNVAVFVAGVGTGGTVTGVGIALKEKLKDVHIVAVEPYSSYTGYERVIEGLFKSYIPVREEKDPKLVNIFGIVPSYDPFFRGDLEEIQRLLLRLGFRANTFFTPDQTIENIRDAGKASLNVNFSAVYGTAQLKTVSESHGIPLKQGRIIHPGETLRSVFQETAVLFFYIILQHSK
jgi:nitrogenase molybdenum-iron protein alpha/beta subunit